MLGILEKGHERNRPFGLKGSHLSNGGRILELSMARSVDDDDGVHYDVYEEDEDCDDDEHEDADEHEHRDEEFIVKF